MSSSEASGRETRVSKSEKKGKIFSCPKKKGKYPGNEGKGENL